MKIPRSVLSDGHDVFSSMSSVNQLIASYLPSPIADVLSHVSLKKGAILLSLMWLVRQTQAVQ